MISVVASATPSAHGAAPRSRAGSGGTEDRRIEQA